MQRGSEPWRDSHSEIIGVVSLHIALVYSVGLCSFTLYIYGRPSLNVLLRWKSKLLGHEVSTDESQNTGAVYSPFVCGAVVSTLAFVIWLYVGFALPVMVPGFTSDCLTSGLSVIVLGFSRLLTYACLILRMKMSFDLGNLHISSSRVWIMLLGCTLLLCYGTGSYVEVLQTEGCVSQTSAALRTSVIMDVFVRVAVIIVLMLELTAVIRSLQRTLVIERQRVARSSGAMAAKVVSSSNTGSLAQLRQSKSKEDVRGMSVANQLKCETGMALLNMCRSVILVMLLTLLSTLLCQTILADLNLTPVAHAVDANIFTTAIILSLPAAQPAYLLICGAIERVGMRLMCPVLTDVEDALGGSLHRGANSRRDMYAETSISSVTRTITNTDPNPFGRIGSPIA